MPFQPSPYNFQSTNYNLWGPSGVITLKYSDWSKSIGTTAYLQNTPPNPPYIIGSTTIQDPSTRFPRMASPLSRPANNEEGIKSLPRGRKFKTVTIKKTLNGVSGIYNIGANSYVGTKENPDKSNPILLTTGVGENRNISIEDTAKRAAAILALGAVSGFTGSPRLIQLGSSAIETLENESAAYISTPFENLKKPDFVPFHDFRTDLDQGRFRLDGATSAIRAGLFHKGKGAVAAGAYAAASGLGGAYSVFNLEATYGFGEHGTPYALRKDFTARSHVATRWNKRKERWQPAGLLDPAAKVTAFRGDKVTVIDFKKTKLASAYRWLPKKNEERGNAIGAAIDKISGRITKDFIKFFFTGPKLTPWDKDAVDDVMVFRAIITSLTDSYNPSWSPVQFIGRGDPSYNYGGYSRDLNLDFTVYATDRDELKPIWRKLNALAGYTAPEYDASSIAMKGPYLRLTVGDLFYQQPIIINSLYYTLQDSETTWEINIEDDHGNMQVPKQIQVSMGATLITDYVPQKGGRFYTLAHKEHLKSDSPESGNGNWLSDMKTNEDLTKIETAVGADPIIDEGFGDGFGQKNQDKLKNIVNGNN